ncbi:MAG: beta-galactosidase [Ruminococcaceae bacterium]|nr:beta-galactosidase [Oscillospiraceae bacterium]
MKGPYIGSAYYPEDWSEEELPRDIARMKNAGMNVARIGEFAWYKMEPEEGKFDFAWLHRIVDALREAEIAVVMGTPSACPPVWFVEKHPDALKMDANGQRSTHGGRRHCCSNHPAYRFYSLRIAEMLAREFGQDENVISWQIDNEIYSNMEIGCCCDLCVESFHHYLERKYGTVDALNRQWNLNLFSQAYASFDQVPAPGHAWHNPHLLLDWTLCHADDHIRFIHDQADVLRRYTDAPIGTDMMPFGGVDHRKMNEKLDVVQYNHYNTCENLWHFAFWSDYMRTLRDTPFWVTETSTCWNGSTSWTQGFKPEGFCRANSWLGVALGAEANLYWLWRTHWAGHELLHGSVLTPSGRPRHTFGEVQETAKGFAKAADFLNDTRVKSEVGIFYTSHNWNMFDTQPHWTAGCPWPELKNFSYLNAILNYFYQPILTAGLRPDVVDAYADLDKYRVLVSPLQLTIEENGLPERLEQWVRDGGTWIVGAMTDSRNAIGAHYTDRERGIVERLAGITQCYEIPDPDGLVKAVWADGTECDGKLWYEVFDCAADTEALVTYTAGHSDFVGRACVTSRKVGKGRIIVVGTFPGADTMARVLNIACAETGVVPYATEGLICVSPREGGGKSGLIAVEIGGKAGSVILDKSMRNILTGEEASGRVEVGPYEVCVWENL